MVVMLISACSAPPLSRAKTGVDYLTDYQPGVMLRVSRAGMGYSDGREAADVAARFCAHIGARLNPAAFGHFNAGKWDFRGGCQ